jgi:hypothetical protein
MSRHSLLLPQTIGIGEAADVARRALCLFLRMPPDPHELEAWFMGAYREATRFGPRATTSALPTERAPEILVAQRSTARVIEAAAGGSEALVKILPDVVHILPAHDHFGGRGLVPFEVHGALIDKTIALAMADYLTRPDDFLAQGYPTGASPLRRISSMMCAVEAEERASGRSSAA